MMSGQLLPKNNRVRHLDVSNNYIQEFPDKLVSRLSQLEKLIFQRNSLQSLSKESFRGLSNLEVIDFHDNRIRDIEEDAFEDLTSLKGLDLSLNIISTVGDTLEPLTSLMKLNLSDNYLVIKILKSLKEYEVLLAHSQYENHLWVTNICLRPDLPFSNIFVYGLL